MNSHQAVSNLTLPPIEVPAKTQAKHMARWERLCAYDDHQRQTFQNRLTPNGLIQGVIGVDEVGRGSLIGPVVAAAVCFPALLSPNDHPWVILLDDSKAPHLNRTNRAQLAEVLQAHTYWGIGQASLEDIERINIANASLLAASRAIEALSQQFQCDLAHYLAIMDGRQRIPQYPYPHTTQIKGDQSSLAIAAASIIAKSTRDILIDTYAVAYPGYGWEANAGYPTPAHQRALFDLGVTPYHRRTYQVVQQALANAQQQTVPQQSTLLLHAEA